MRAGGRLLRLISKVFNLNHWFCEPSADHKKRRLALAPSSQPQSDTGLPASKSHNQQSHPVFQYILSTSLVQSRDPMFYLRTICNLARESGQPKLQLTTSIRTPKFARLTDRYHLCPHSANGDCRWRAATRHRRFYRYD